MAEIYLATIDGNGSLVLIPATDAGIVGNKQAYVPYASMTLDGALIGPNNPLPVKSSSVTPQAGNAVVVTTAGTSVIAILANTITLKARIVNPISGNGSLFVDPVNDPDIVAPGVHGTTEEIPAGQFWEAPGPLTTEVRVNSPTDGHAFTNVIY